LPADFRAGESFWTPDTSVKSITGKPQANWLHAAYHECSAKLSYGPNE
jgi:hypothetical protein